MAYKWLNIWYGLPKPQLQRPSFWALILDGNQGDVGLGLVNLFSVSLSFSKTKS